MLTEIVLVVAPLSQLYDAALSDESVTALPWQTVALPDKVILGFGFWYVNTISSIRYWVVVAPVWINCKNNLFTEGKPVTDRNVQIAVPDPVGNKVNGKDV